MAVKNNKQARKNEAMNKGSSDDRLPVESILAEYQRVGAKGYSLLDTVMEENLKKWVIYLIANVP